MASASCLHHDLKTHDRGVVLIGGSFQLNGSSAVSAVKGTGFTVARAAAGRFSVTWENEYASVLSATATLEHTTDVSSKVCWDALSSTAKTGEIRLQTQTAAVAASGTATFDTKLNSTDEDYFILNDGDARYCFVLDVAGDGTALTVAGLPCDYLTAVDISGATTAADVAALFDTAIDGTAIKITSTDVLDGSLSLSNDRTGVIGNTKSVLSETGTTLLAITDMTGGTDLTSFADADLSAGRVHFKVMFQKT
jgi:hypothetical protein